ncbi:MAG: flagellar export chaperone FliS [Defluviitaleaceae bacterium]|nr:flagellar export chaperone FliS [Defluviitaleaceae bacterium]
MPTNPYEKMQEDRIFTASKEELTLMLFDGALKFCNQALAAMESKDIAKANTYIMKVQNIILEFQMTLDKQYEVSKYLNSMYDYIYRRLVDANIQKSPEVLIEAKDLIKDLRNTWREAMKIAKVQASSGKAGIWNNEV